MEELVVFFTVLLGVLKYANLFAKQTKEKRKLIYFGISVGFSLIAAVIYLVIADAFTIEYFAAVSGAIYALNQTMYAVYDTTPLHTLLGKVLEFLSNFANKPKVETATPTPETNTEE